MQFDKKTFNRPGIYLITNLNNNKRYIGSATSIYHRIHTHLWSLRKNIHHNILLQRAYNKYGEVSFDFKILATCPKEYLIKLEQRFLDVFLPEYNLNKTAGSMLGVVRSIETIEKQRLALTGRKQSIEHIRKRFENRIYTISEQIREKIRLGNLGKKRSVESIQKQIAKRVVSIDQYDLDKKFLKTWNSIKEIKDFYGITNLSSKLKRGSNLIKGYYWEYHSLI